MPYKVLLAEDDLDLQRLYQVYLQEQGLEVKTASDGREALEILKKEKFDLLITDIRMPNMTGIELIRQSREFQPDLPSIIVSGEGTISEAAEAVNLKVFHYLQKPIHKLEQLKEVVFQALENNNSILLANNHKLQQELKILKSVLLEIYHLPRFSQIISGIVHNINTPLGGVTGYTQLIMMKNPELKGLEMVNEQAGKIIKLLKTVAEKGYSENNYQVTQINLSKLVERETEYLNFNLFYKHQVEKVLQLSLVPSFKGIYHQIANCFHHLIYNALDAIYDTKKKLITITTDSQNGKVLLKVSDTGIGIPRENMNKIFDIGFTTKLNPSQVPERDYPSGYGLGLYIVRKILNNYGGEIHIESKVGEGTVVEVAIPLKQKL